MKVGILREGKIKSDTRVPLTPKQCRYLQTQNPDLEIFVQPSQERCFSDFEYHSQGISVTENLAMCDLLLGVKEVPLSTLLPDKTYLFFSHTIKKQPYNRELLRSILQHKIRLIDYECLRDSSGQRVIAFGRWAGIVGAHNAILTWGLREGKFNLKPMYQCNDWAEAQTHYPNLPLSQIKLVVTGEGRVAHGATEVLDLMKIKRVAPQVFLAKNFNEPVYTQLTVKDMYRRKGQTFFDQIHYYQNPEQYESIFAPYTHTANIMLNGIYWDRRIPVFFSKEDMKGQDFTIRVIADVTCDIAPNSSIPSTIRASSIEEPIYGYDPILEQETKPFQSGCIDVMAVDNLPNELPRDASEDFGNQLISKVWTELNQTNSRMIYEATITVDGDLNQPYEYLRDYVS
ncbi:MAG: NAD(P)-dependent oxidoreductase [Xenococcaceae cyanobacterium MO_167.B52]|nr:NAD(P)-dependent oxidoreductase [Xenococcaceae cyanobacterium MO_167.B52]